MVKYSMRKKIREIFPNRHGNGHFIINNLGSHKVASERISQLLSDEQNDYKPESKLQSMKCKYT